METASAIEYLNEIDNGIMGDVTNYMAKEPPYAENLFGELFWGQTICMVEDWEKAWIL